LIEDYLAPLIPLSSQGEGEIGLKGLHPSKPPAFINAKPPPKPLTPSLVREGVSGQVVYN